MPSISPSTVKRKADAPISPPPIKRKVHTGTTNTAVANFFTPASQKPKDRTVWSERAPNDDSQATLLVARYRPETETETETNDRTTLRRKIAAFDLDSTLIATSSGKRHSSEATDWRWWHNQVPGRLRDLYKDGHRVVILSNQAGLALHFDRNYKGPKAGAQKRVTEFKAKCSAVLANLNLPVSLYAATEKDTYRKPCVGMWQEVRDDYDIPESELDLENSFFVGDAGGRTAHYDKAKAAAGAKDFSCSDRNFAHNVGITYKTPEEYFLGEEPRPFVRDFDLESHPFAEAPEAAPAVFEKRNEQEIVLFCGSPGAGKSTFFWKHLKPLGYVRVNQDILKSRDKCLQAATESLKEHESVAIDNTNADVETRAVWISLAQRFKIPIRCIWFRTPLQVAEHNSAARQHNQELNPESRLGLPKVAFTGFVSRFKPPTVKEGFLDLTEVPFVFNGSKEEYASWARYCI